MWISLAVGGKTIQNVAVTNAAILGGEFPVIFPTFKVSIALTEGLVCVSSNCVTTENAPVVTQ
jgi:hypothetical protein